MNTSLDHLPEGKRRELERVLELLFRGFEDATKNKNVVTRKAGRILKVVLYRSYAPGRLGGRSQERLAFKSAVADSGACVSERPAFQATKRAQKADLAAAISGGANAPLDLAPVCVRTHLRSSGSKPEKFVRNPEPDRRCAGISVGRVPISSVRDREGRIVIW